MKASAKSHNKARTKYICILGFIISFCSPSTVQANNNDWASRNSIIVVGGDYNFPPYEFIDKEGNPAGYNVDITRAIAEVMGIQVQITLGNWDTMRDGLNNGEINILQGMTITPERQLTLNFSPAHAKVQQSIFARRGTAAPLNLDDLAGKEVIVQNLGSMHDYLLQNNVDAKIIPVKTHVDALRLLSSGKHDFAIVANLPGLYLGKELGLSNIKVVAKPFTARGYGYASTKDNEELLAQFSEGFAILQNTGRQQEIYDKWLGLLEKDSYTYWKEIGMAAAILSVLMLLALGGIFTWNRALRSQVDKRTKELHMQQQQLIQADKMASLGVLVSGVAHEINNPTGLLLLNLPVLDEAWQDSRSHLENHYQENGDFNFGGLKYSRLRDEIPLMINEMHDGAKKIRNIVEDLKDFARHDNAAEGEIIHLNHVAAAAIRLVENSTRKATNHFSVKYADDLPKIHANGQRIEQVIINMILNACQALNSKQDTIHIETKHEPEKNQVSLTIRDSGCGIDEENMLRITDPFFTTKRELGGTGLGLSVSASIIKAHNGILHFDSKIGIGTTATLTLPIKDFKNND